MRTLQRFVSTHGFAAFFLLLLPHSLFALDADPYLAATFSGHTSAINFVAVSPDGKLIASASDDNTVRLWSVTDGMPVTTFKGHKKVPYCESIHCGPLSVAFSPDGKSVASADRLGVIYLWNLNGTILKTFNVKGGGSKTSFTTEDGTLVHTTIPAGIWDLKFSGDGKYLVARAENVHVFNVETGAVHLLKTRFDGPLGMALGPDGKTLAVADVNTVSLWSLGGSLLRFLWVPFADWRDAGITSVAFDPQGKYIAGNFYSGALWKVNGAFVRTLLKPPGMHIEGFMRNRGVASSIAYSPDGRYFAVGGESRSSYNVPTIALYSKTGMLVHAYHLSDDNPSDYGLTTVNSVVFTPDSKFLVSGGEDGAVRLWSVPPVLFHEKAVLGLAFRPDGRTLVSAGKDKLIKLWDSHTGALLKTVKGHAEEVRSIAFSPDGKMMASGSSDETVKLWSADGALLRTLNGHTGPVTSVAFSPDGKTLASAGYDKTVKLWSVDGELQKTFAAHDGVVWSVAFSPDGKTIATGGQDSAVKLWTPDGALIKTFAEHEKWVASVAFSPDGKTIASAGQDGVWLWDFEEEKSRKLYEKTIYVLAFHKDGQHLVLGGEEKMVTIEGWRTAENVQDKNSLKREEPEASKQDYEYYDNEKFVLTKTVVLEPGDKDYVDIEYYHPSHWILSAAFTSDGSRVALGQFGGVVDIVNFYQPDKSPYGDATLLCAAAQECLDAGQQADDPKPYYELAVKLWKPEDGNTLLAKAYLKRAQTEWDEKDKVLADYNKAIETDPSYVVAYRARAEYFKYANDLLNAVKDYTSALNVGGDNAEDYLHRGQAYADAGDYDKAIADYNKALNLNPASPWPFHILYARGRAFYLRGSLQEAVDDFTSIIRSGTSPGLFERARAYFDMGQYENAILDFEASASFIIPAPYVGMAISYFQLGNFEKAEEYYKKAVEVDDRYAGKVDEIIKSHEKKDNVDWFTQKQVLVIKQMIHKLGY